MATQTTGSAIRVARNHKLERMLVGPCGRCAGTGQIPAFGHVRGGTCFACCGSGMQKLGAKVHQALFVSLTRLATGSRA